MVRNVGQFLPIEGFTYKTQYGNYVAQISNALDEIVDRGAKCRFELNLVNPNNTEIPVRRLVLHARPDQVETNRSEVFRYINKWAFLHRDSAEFLSSEWVFDLGI